MAFTLYLVRQNFSQITGGEVRKYFKGRPHMETGQEGTALKVTYLNPATAATCVFTFNSSGLPRPDDRPGAAYASLQLSCRMELLKPSHFAFEAAREVERLQNALMLSVLSPYSKKSPDMPAHLSAMEILGDWQEENRKAIASRMKDTPPPFVGSKLSGALWKFLMAKEALAETLGERAPVPDVEVLRTGGTPKAMTAIRWSDCAPTALPACQSVLVDKVLRKGLFGIGRKEESGIARYEDVLRAMKEHLQTASIEKPRYSVPVLMAERAKGARRAFKSIPLNPLPEKLEPVAIDSFVDVWPKK